MIARRTARALEHQRLLDRIADQRHGLRVAARAWRQPLALVDVALAASRIVRRHPLALLAVYGLAQVLGPMPVRHVVGWVMRGRRIAALLRMVF
ncbi:MAG: hypothetical protein AB7I01_09035 [Gammaproteobacteria bacterium]